MRRGYFVPYVCSKKNVYVMPIYDRVEGSNRSMTMLGESEEELGSPVSPARCSVALGL